MEPSFLVGKRGKRELQKLLQTTTDPEATIQGYQESHSLHSMIANALGTVPQYQAQAGGPTESLDTDSALNFLSHLGVPQYEVHKRVSDALRTRLEDEIRKAKSNEPLLQLLQSCFYYSIIPELRPVLWAVLKKLGTDTPRQVLEALAERDKNGDLKHAEVWHPLPPLLKRLVWEADWDKTVTSNEPDDPKDFYALAQSSLFGEHVQPIIDEYCNQKLLVESANRPFVYSLRERRMVTTQRRAQVKDTAAATSDASLSKAVLELRDVLAGETPAFRPKLLNAFLSMLMARHGSSTNDTALLGGAKFLHCTLVADILMSRPIPKVYQHVLALARTLDEAVKVGGLSDAHIAQVQVSLRQIYPVPTPESQAPESSSTGKSEGNENIKDVIKAALKAMKDADPQSLFLNPVTDAIAPGYSKVIKQPMCIKTMERKMDSYTSLQEWERDVQLIFANCIAYNIGNDGQWFRGEARRQEKIFREDIYPQARRLYQRAIAQRSGQQVAKQKDSDDSSKQATVEPLTGTKAQKRKKSLPYPSIPALASMLLADPFVVRLLLDRALRCLRIDINRGASLPAAHRVLPSVLQLLHLATWSTQLCAIRGKRYFVPNVGLDQPAEGDDDPTSVIPYASLRRFIPLLMKLFLESELDRRSAIGSDLQPAAQAMPDRSNAVTKEMFQDASHLHVMRCLAEAALVYICQPGNSQENSLAITFPKFGAALQGLSTNLWDERPFFLSLIQALVRHKSKMSKAARDVIVATWLKWLAADKEEGSNEGSMTSAAHECFVMLLNEWAAFGNLVLPRDKMLEFSADAARAAESSESAPERKLSVMWNNPDFGSVKSQYERILHNLPEAQAQKWKDELGVAELKKTGDEMEVEPTKEDNDE